MPNAALRLFLLFLTLFVAFMQDVRAQQWVRGEVQDANTGETLPSATIQVEGTTRGTITNVEGRFELFVTPVPSTLLVRHIGYRSLRITITSDTQEQITVGLEPATLLLEEVVVSGEDPALNIMRKVLAKKKAWRSGLQSTYAEVYSRFMLYSEQRLVQVQETINAGYWRAEGGGREVIRAQRIKPPEGGDFRFAKPTYVPNFYDDNVEVMGCISSELSG